MEYEWGEGMTQYGLVAEGNLNESLEI